jgi:hypothetical protein
MRAYVAVILVFVRDAPAPCHPLFVCKLFMTATQMPAHAVEKNHSKGNRDVRFSGCREGLLFLSWTEAAVDAMR